MAEYQIPLVNLRAQYLSLRDQIKSAIDEVLESGSFIQGKKVKELEAQFAHAHGASHAIACSNGTSALSLSFEALGLGPDDEIILPSHTFFATAEAILHVRAKPVFVDIDEHTYTISPKKVREALTNRTRAIVPVHIHGNPCDMHEILAIARNKSLKIIEDCAQAHLAKLDGKSVGTFGDIGTFSFYPGKNLGAYGDAGIVFCRSSELEIEMRMLADHGRFGKKYVHDKVGYNQRMDEIQAAVLLVKLKYLGSWTSHRQKCAEKYQSKLQGFRMMQPTAGSSPVYHHFTVEVKNRDEVFSRLSSEGIFTGIHYPVPLHLQPALKYLGYKKGDFPIAEQLSDRTISLPICDQLKLDELDYICERFLKVAQP